MLVSQPPPQPLQPPAWSVKRLGLHPPLLLSQLGGIPPTSNSPSPFPRYGHSLPANVTTNGDLYIFGGLVDGTLSNDLYLFSTRDNTATFVQTTGPIPSPRVGHASALFNNMLIVWGGDTKVGSKRSVTKDEGLFMLNLLSKEWTGVLVHGISPVGSYGDAVAMAGSKFYIFGGQAHGSFYNELWAFDLELITEPSLELVELSSPEKPARRMGHICIAYDNRLIIFGGTNGQYHYNDTWSFDIQARKWTELTCIGFIPVAREGHAAAIVDDAIYIFGGRGADGKELGDLAAFKISNQRWYTFPDMGPAPAGRSGHAMAAAGTRVYVFGGESFSDPTKDEPNTFTVLDTKHIKNSDSDPVLSDGLYLEILNRSPDQDFLKIFLGFLVARRSISGNNLSDDDAMLMNISRVEFREKMNSILDFEPYILRQSFLDFLQDPSRSFEYHVSKTAGTRRYLEMITKLLIGYAVRLTNQPDFHGTDHFDPEFGKLINRNPQAIELDIEDWEQILSPLLNVLDDFLVPSNIDSLMDGYCQRCRFFQITNDILTHLKSLRERKEPDVEKYLNSLEKITSAPGTPMYGRFPPSPRPASTGSGSGRENGNGGKKDD